jgi:hypothetical protein
MVAVDATDLAPIAAKLAEAADDVLAECLEEAAARCERTKLRWLVTRAETVLNDWRAPLRLDVPWFADRCRWLGVTDPGLLKLPPR